MPRFGRLPWSVPDRPSLAPPDPQEELHLFTLGCFNSHPTSVLT